MPRLHYAGAFSPANVPFVMADEATDLAEYASLPEPKAIAIRAVWTRYSIVSGSVSAAEAERQALDWCGEADPKVRFPCFVYASGMQVVLPEGATLEAEGDKYRFPEGSQVRYAAGEPLWPRPEAFDVESKLKSPLAVENGICTLPTGCIQLVRGSSWGTFTIACTIPIALFVAVWMYKIRKGHIVEASLIGAVGVLAATVVGGLIPGSPLEWLFSLTKGQTVLALTIYGFVASVLPVIE